MTLARLWAASLLVHLALLVVLSVAAVRERCVNPHRDGKPGNLTHPSRM